MQESELELDNNGNALIDVTASSSLRRQHDCLRAGYFSDPYEAGASVKSGDNVDLLGASPPDPSSIQAQSQDLLAAELKPSVQCPPMSFVTTDSGIFSHSSSEPAPPRLAPGQLLNLADFDRMSLCKGGSTQSWLPTATPKNPGLRCSSAIASRSRYELNAIDQQNEARNGIYVDEEEREPLGDPADDEEEGIEPLGDPADNDEEGMEPPGDLSAKDNKERMS